MGKVHTDLEEKMIKIGPIEKAWKWFEGNHERVFDSLDIPNDNEVARMFRDEATVRILRNLKMERGPCGRCMERGLFCEEMVNLLRAAGYKRPPGEDRFSIRSLKSTACLEMVWDTARLMALAAAKR